MLIISIMQIKPLIVPTRNIIDIGVQYDWHELFPKGTPSSFITIDQMLWKLQPETYTNNLIRNFLLPVQNNAGAVIAIWAPVIVVSVSINNLPW